MSLPPPAELPVLSLERGAAATIDRLARAEDGGVPVLATRVDLVDDGERLVVRFDCDDPEPWATHREHDAPLWEEEVVELFIAPGDATPTAYFEFEVNPLGTLFDARIVSPHGDRREMTVDRAWECAGIDVAAAPREDGSGWRARVAIPWRALAAGKSPASWRLNLFRIERPRGAGAEFSAWSPTFVAPADFHRPARFGFLRRLG